MNNSRKILHISPTDIRFDNRILKELKSLEELEFLELLAFGINDDEVHKYSIEPISYIKTFSLFSTKLKISKPLKYIIILVESVLRLTIPAIKYNPKVIHCHDTFFLPIALIIKFFCKSKLIYDAHELESQKNRQSIFLSRCTLIIEKISWRFIDLFISVSPSIIDWYQKKLGTKDYLLILNSPQLHSQNLNGKPNIYLRDKFKIPINSKVFIYLGIIGKGRGIDLYLNAFKDPDVNSHIVFIGNGEYVTKVQNASLISEKIHYHKAVNPDQVIEIAKSADVGLSMIEEVSLSYYFCLPNKLFEYAFSGLFILASDFPDIKKVIYDFDLGVCSSLDAESIKQKIIYIEGQDLKPSTKDLSTLSWQYQSEKLLKAYNYFVEA